MAGLLIAKTEVSQCLRISVVYRAGFRLLALHPFRGSCGTWPKIGQLCSEEKERNEAPRGVTQGQIHCSFCCQGIRWLGAMICASGRAPTCPPHLCTMNLEAAAAVCLIFWGCGINKIGIRAMAGFPFWKFAVQVSCLFWLCLELILYAQQLPFITPLKLGNGRIQQK